MNILTLTIIFPLIGFLLLIFSQGSWSKNYSAVVGVCSVGLAMLVTVYIGINFINNDKQLFTIPLWTWMSIDNFNINLNLILDSFSMIMLFIVTGIGFLVHMFASWYMRREDGYSRFFGYMNLFVSSMLILILADNLLLMYVGWELVGLCSYLLISFYQYNLKNIAAAMKAFIITRIGDIFLIFAIFVIYKELGTLNFRELMELTSDQLKINKDILQWITMLLLVGAVSKSAQLPLQNWLANAMVGPTPVSALIHSATMVTAGIYLIIRTQNLFLMTPNILYLVSIIGAVTLILASFTALIQTDIKRILAYSTMSQTGYMFMALGVQAWNAAIFHLVIHAFFKSLLFLSAGSLTLSCHHEQNIFRMGGLRKSIPLVYFCFLVGGAALSALPLLTAGFFSKEKILIEIMISDNINLVIVGLIGAFITSLYTFRMIFVIFHGESNKIHVCPGKGIIHHLPLVILMILSILGGVIITPMLNWKSLNIDINKSENVRIFMLEIISSILSIIGVLVAALIWLEKRISITTIFNKKLVRTVDMLRYNEWGLNRLYDLFFVKPFLIITRLIKCDPINILMNIPSTVIYFANKIISFSENGYLRWYIIFVNLSIVIILMLIVMHYF